MGDAPTWLAWLVFGAWAVASLLALVPRFHTVLRGFDILSLVPQWNFFAPTPGRGDYSLLYRDRLRDQSVTGWKQVQIQAGRTWTAGLWYPQKRGVKALFDVVTELGRQVVERVSTVQASLAFLTLLQHVSAIRPRLEGAAEVQVLLLYHSREEPGREPELLFASSFFPLE